MQIAGAIHHQILAQINKWLLMMTGNKAHDNQAQCDVTCICTALKLCCQCSSAHAASSCVMGTACWARETSNKTHPQSQLGPPEFAWNLVNELKEVGICAPIVGHLALWRQGDKGLARFSSLHHSAHGASCLLRPCKMSVYVLTVDCCNGGIQVWSGMAGHAQARLLPLRP